MLFELLVDSDRDFEPLETTVREQGFPAVAKTPGGERENGAGVDVEVGTPSLGTERFDLLLPLKLAPMLSLESLVLEPSEVRLSLFSREIRLP